MVEKEEVMEKLRTIDDPEIGVSIVDMGFIYSVDIDGGEVEIEMTLTTPGCPMHSMFVGQVKDRVSEIEGVEDVSVELVFDPPWSPERMSDEAKEKLGMKDE